MADKTVLFEAGEAGPPFLERAGMTCEFKVITGVSQIVHLYFVFLTNVSPIIHCCLPYPLGLPSSCSFDKQRGVEVLGIMDQDSSSEQLVKINSIFDSKFILANSS